MIFPKGYGKSRIILKTEFDTALFRFGSDIPAHYYSIIFH